MSVIDNERDFTRPKGNAFEIRSKFVAHRARSALLLKSSSIHKLDVYMQQSKKVPTGKRKYKYVPPPNEGEITSRTRNKARKVNTIVSSGVGTKLQKVIEPSKARHPSTQELQEDNDNDLRLKKGDIKRDRMNHTFFAQNFRLKPQFECEKQPPMENDALKPKGYEKYEALVKNQKELQRIANLSCSTKMYSTKELKEKMLKSDIFFKVPCLKNAVTSKRTSTAFVKREKSQSDIFFKVNDSVSLNKSGEQYLFVPSYNDKYTIAKESKSNWSAQASNPTLLNHSNSVYHILNPSIKNISTNKQDLLSYYNYNDYFMSRRQKSLCEFIDRTRNGSPNPNQDYLANFIRSKQCFHKTKNVCCSLIDLGSHYKNLVDKPFAPLHKESYQYH